MRIRGNCAGMRVPRKELRGKQQARGTVVCGSLTCREKVVCVSDEANVRHGILVGEERLVAIAEVETPHFDVFVRRAGDEERVVG